MSNNINASLLKNFIIKTVGADKLTANEARKYDIDSSDFNEANKDENNYLELDEILKDDDIYEQFATLFVEEREKADVKDAEKEKEEETKVKDKNGAGV